MGFRIGTSGGGTTPVYEDAARHDAWMSIILAGTLAITLVMGAMIFTLNPVVGSILFGLTAFDAALFHAIVPRRYEIREDRVRIVLGRPFVFDLPLNTIAEARPGHGGMAIAYMGLRFACSTKTVVEIVRRGAMNVVIAPQHREAFVDRLAEVLARRYGR